MRRRNRKKNNVVIRLRRENGAEDLPTIRYATLDSSGLDLYAAIPDTTPVSLLAGERVLISTGISVAIPKGYEAQVRARSGLALDHGIAILNAPGTIDSDYRGVICVLLVNFGHKPFVVKRGDRVAQMVVVPVVHARIKEVRDLDVTQRNGNGFGSTGT